MKLIRLKILIPVLLVSISAAGTVGYREWQQYVAEQERIESWAKYERANKEKKRIQAELQAKENQRPHKDKGLAEEIGKASYRSPASEWLKNEKAQYTKLLSPAQYDVLIVPFQVQDYAFDRATRSLMTAELALAFSLTEKFRVPDPYLVARALGDGMRRISAADIYQLANQLGVKRIVWGYVGHDKNSKMALTIQSQERKSGTPLNENSPINSYNYENQAFSDEDPAIEAYQRLLPDIFKKLDITDQLLSAAKSSATFGADTFPNSPTSLIFDESVPARDAYSFQLLASLAPKYSERTRERFAEKSLLTLLRLSESAPQYRTLKARAYMLLGLRPAALKVLGQPQSTEETELFHALNGNLPEVSTAASKLKGVSNFVAMLDANSIGATYGSMTESQSQKSAENLKLPGRIWPYFAQRAMTDGYLWSQYENIFLKALLDIEFPIKSSTAAKIINSGKAINDADKAHTMMDLSVWDHIKELQENNPEKWNSKAVFDRPSTLDYLDLIDAMATDNLMRRAKMMTYAQGLPEKSLHFLDRIESVYKGHPRYALARGKAKAALAMHATGPAKEELRKEAFAEARNAMFWEQGQSRTSAEAVWLSIRPEQMDFLGNLYVSDLPFHPYYSTWVGGGIKEQLIPNAQAALHNATWEFGPVKELREWLEGNTEENANLLNLVKGRFNGNPGMLRILAEMNLNKGDIPTAEIYYREGIKQQPGYWENYADLGNTLFFKGEIKKAYALYASYPGFAKDSTEDRVALSNMAAQAGHGFFLTGNFKQAVPLYKISVSQNTGSHAEMLSNERLSLLQGDFIGAATSALHSGQRYESEKGYRDYSNILHAMGHHKEAWNTFDMLIRKENMEAALASALVGHRVTGTNEEEIITWAKRDDIKKPGSSSSNGAIYLARASLIDRSPSNNLITAISEINHTVWIAGDIKNKLILSSQDHGKTRLDKPNRGTTLGKSQLLYLAEAHRALRAGDYISAHSTFKEALELYDVSVYSTSHMLPYAAFSAAKAGKPEDVKRILDKISAQKQDFDYFLALAVMEGMNGKTEQSLNFLRKSLIHLPTAIERPVYAEYEYAEICEWLYLATKHAKFKEEALDWARKNQKMQPWHAWPYAMTAKLTSNHTERQRAIAMAAYLDRNSERLSTIPKQEIDAAVKIWGKLNPFLQIQSGKSQERNKI